MARIATEAGEVEAAAGTPFAWLPSCSSRSTRCLELLASDWSSSPRPTRWADCSGKESRQDNNNRKTSAHTLMLKFKWNSTLG